MTNRVLGGVAGMFSNRAKMSNPVGPAPKKRECCRPRTLGMRSPLAEPMAISQVRLLSSSGGDASERQGTARRMLSRRKPKAEQKTPDVVVQAV